MNTIELTAKGSDNVVAHACGKCRIVAPSHEDAERCCEPRKCETCGAIIGASYCSPCFVARTEAEEQARFDKATKVPASSYDGDYLFAEGVGSGDGGDGYFSDEEALRDACESRGVKMPSYAWACTEHKMGLDGPGIIEDALENQEAHEDAADNIPSAAMTELSAFLTAWANKHGPISYHPDYSRAVVFAPLA